MGAGAQENRAVEHELTICESPTSNWVCLAKGRGAIEACRAGSDLSDGVHDDC